jgi:hypothetical protein
MLGYPKAALVACGQTLDDARKTGQAPTLIYALAHAPFTQLQCGNYTAANAIVNELIALADEKGAVFWQPFGLMHQGMPEPNAAKAQAYFERACGCA